MAVRLNPCHGCALRKGCALRDEFRQRVAGLGLRSATFRCARLAAELRPGRRVAVRTPRLVVDAYDRPELRRDGDYVVSATVTQGFGDSFTCVVDAGQPGTAGEHVRPTVRFRRPMRAQRIVRFLDEPDRPVCAQGRALLPSGTCDRPAGEACGCTQGLEI